MKKLFWLPLKWKLDKMYEAYSVVYPHPLVIQERLRELRSSLLKARQDGDVTCAASAQGQIDALKWVLRYGKS